MSDQYKIFVGYSEDAALIASDIGALKNNIQSELNKLNELVSNSKKTCVIFDWKFDAPSTIGGQAQKIDPFIQTCDIAVFPFVSKAGEGVRNELNKCVERRVPVVALFPKEIPDIVNTQDAVSLQAWMSLINLRSEISDSWMDTDSNAVTPQKQYESQGEAIEIVRDRIFEDMHRIFREPALRNGGQIENGTAHLAEDSYTSRNGINKLYPDIPFDMEVVQKYAELLLDRRNGKESANIRPDELIKKMGFLVGNTLTVGGVLLFTSRPSEHINTAVFQCTRYFGKGKASRREITETNGPIFLQMDSCIDFIKRSTGMHEYPQSGSSQSEVTYEYPMLCVRELVANSICHRDYLDAERQSYVRVFDDRIEIANPGMWRGSEYLIDEREITELISEPVHTNYHISRAFGKIGYIELEGSGIGVAADDCRKNSARIPTVRSQDGFVIVTIYPSSKFDLLKNQRGAGELAFDSSSAQFKLVSIQETTEEELIFEALVDTLEFNIGRLEHSNTFAAIGGTVKKLKSLLESNPRNPLRVYDVMEGSLFSIQHMSANGEIPSIGSDADLSEFVHVLERGLIDLRIVNPKIEEIIESRARQILRKLNSSEQRDLIQALGEIETLLDGDLREEFAEDSRGICESLNEVYKFEDISDELVRIRTARIANRIEQMSLFGTFAKEQILKTFEAGIDSAKNSENYRSITQVLKYLLSLISVTSEK